MGKRLLSTLLLLLTFALLNGCQGGPGFSGDKVKREYFTNGKIRSEFIMSDDTGQNGLLKRYGPEGELTSTVPIRNGVKDGIEKLYDKEGRVVKTTPYVSGRKDGNEKGYFPDGTVWFSLPYKKGVLNGEAFIYRRDGSILRRGIYRNGKLVN